MKTLCGLVMLLLLLASWTGAFANGVMSVHDLQCKWPNGKEISIVRVSRSRTDKMFIPRPEEKVIEFSPQTRLPEAAAKLEFAQACLEVIEQPSEVCDAVQYLRRWGALDSSEISELEEYYFAEDDPKSLQTIQEVYDCYKYP